MKTSDRSVDFGFEKVPWAQKAERVRAVFSSVAGKYDLMNDLMSFGAHRLWKHFTLSLTGLKAGQRALDVAGGTGDLAAGLARQVGKTGQVVLSDINPDMLAAGRDRLIDAGFAGNVECVLADAERLPCADDCFDCVTIGFGLRNVTDKAAALSSMHRVLKPGGQLLVLEFSTARRPGSQADLRRLLVRRAAAPRRMGCEGRGELSLPGGVDPHAPGPGDAARHARRGGIRANSIPQSHRAASSPSTAGTRSDMPATPVWLAAIESLLNRGIDQSIRARGARPAG